MGADNAKRWGVDERERAGKSRHERQEKEWREIDCG
jgi:hypothetical protein